MLLVIDKGEQFPRDNSELLDVTAAGINTLIQFQTFVFTRGLLLALSRSFVEALDPELEICVIVLFRVPKDLGIVGKRCCILKVFVDFASLVDRI